MLTGLVAGVFSLLANPFLEAEQSFLAELNSMDGIALVGGPFHASEQHHFAGESGYFVIAPALVLPTLDQRLSVQTKTFTVTTRSNTLPIATSPHTHADTLEPKDRRVIQALLARNGLAVRRDEITLFENGAVQLRPVQHLPLLKTFSPETNTCIALLGAQTWQGVPLYRASFDRTRGDFALETLRESFVPRRQHELPLRVPIFNPQTFFAEPGLAIADWTKLLRNFSRLDLPAIEIIEAATSDRLVTLYADTQRPVLPQYWAKLQKQNGAWQFSQAVEFRAEFPRPGPWWTFLPLLPETKPSIPIDPAADSAIPVRDQREIISIIQRLRGTGQLTSLAALPHTRTFRARTTHDTWRGYHLDFTRLQNAWRLTSVSEWTE